MLEDFQILKNLNIEKFKKILKERKEMALEIWKIFKNSNDSRMQKVLQSSWNLNISYY